MLHQIVALVFLYCIHATPFNSQHLDLDQFLTTGKKFFIKQPPKLPLESIPVIANTSFRLSLNCTSKITIRQQSICHYVQNGLYRVFLRLSKVLHLPQPVGVTVRFSTPCLDLKLTNINANCTAGKTLAFASPNGFLTFDNGTKYLDPNYQYPMALARQYFPNHTFFLTNVMDMTLTIMGDQDWWFNTGETPTFPLMTEQNVYFQKKVYDFEQLVLHEMLHGFGFISSWSIVRNRALFVPSGLERLNGRIIGLSKSYIYDRYMADSFTGVWLSDMAELIRLDATRIAKQLNTSNSNAFYAAFMNTTGGTIARYLHDRVHRPRSILSWYRCPQGYWKRVMLHTTTTFDGSSSMSHLDSTLYDGSQDYIMRPFASSGVALDYYTPMGNAGPIGMNILGLLSTMGYIKSVF